ncbi:MAG: T9SS type A sorting domain-containing protein [Ignavibacteria bacterium]|nr:T9SS type A sorting domain-containing protein [Ignavibacteria bacterium]
MGGDSTDAASSLTLDGAGNIYTIGWFSGKADFDPGQQSYSLTSVGLRDIFISKLDSSGNFTWAERMGGSYDDLGIDVSVDRSGTIYSIGYFAEVGDFSLDNNFTYKLTSSGSHDAFIKKFSPSVIVPQENIFLTYPNPCSDFLNLDLTKTITNGKLRIFDLLGQLVFEIEEVTGDTFVIDISNQPSGLYFIEVYQNETTYRTAIVKY